jgi:hypothetical protein
MGSETDRQDHVPFASAFASTDEFVLPSTGR